MSDSVEIVFHGQAATAATRSRESVPLEQARTIGELLTHIAEVHGPALRQLLITEQGQMQRSLLLMVNGVRVMDIDVALNGGDQVLVLPPISGG